MFFLVLIWWNQRTFAVCAEVLCLAKCCLSVCNWQEIRYVAMAEGAGIGNSKKHLCLETECSIKICTD